jgi:hypothetical protein
MIYNKVILLPWGMWLALVYNILQLFVLSGCSLCTMDGDEGVSMGENPSHHEQMQANSVLSSIIYIYIYNNKLEIWSKDSRTTALVTFFFPFTTTTWLLSQNAVVHVLSCMYVCMWHWKLGAEKHGCFGTWEALKLNPAFRDKIHEKHAQYYDVNQTMS